MPACCVQVCREEADVKRALQAWSQYRTSGRQPAELYEARQPKKRTLASMWGLPVASEGSRKQAELTAGSPACNAQHDGSAAARVNLSLQGSSDFQATKELDRSPEDLSPAGLKGAEALASCHTASAATTDQKSDNAHESVPADVGACKDAAQASMGTVAQAADSDAEILDNEHASVPSRMIQSGRSETCDSAGQERVAYPTRNCMGGSSHRVQCITTSSRGVTQSRYGKVVGPANALSVLMENSKPKQIGAASPQSEKKARPKFPAPQAFQQSSWKGALDPER